MKKEFKVGDRVRMITSSFPHYSFGDVGVICGDAHGSLLVSLLVNFFDDRLDRSWGWVTQNAGVFWVDFGDVEKVDDTSPIKEKKKFNVISAGVEYVKKQREWSGEKAYTI
jgi:hypothetical protein